MDQNWCKHKNMFGR